ncbi:MAG: hypothetical protein HY690_10605 [Chloroflexi bacterium]|nr:hypothetical protein [Chloroflexota bacterium]
MSTEQERERERPEGQRIAVSASDESVAKLQLAARWAELYAPQESDALPAMLKRFRHVYEFLDAITHGIEPPGE